MTRKRRNSDFWECMIVTETGCWEWQGSRDGDGYGQVSVNGKLQKTHRRAFELTYGYLPEVVRHYECDNPPCYNPAHLRGGTVADNVADKVRKGRGRSSCLRGELSTSAKLKASDVIQIRERYAAGGLTQRQLAKQYDITQAQVSQIVLKKKWKDV